VFLTLALTSRVAWAQQGPLPPLPAPTPQTAPGQPAPAPAGVPQNAPATPPGYYPQPPGLYPPPDPYSQAPIPAAPPAVQYAPPPVPVHAPRYSLYAGASLRYIGFGGYFYENEFGQAETTGNFVQNGPAIELNVGARLGKRYIPYLLWEHGFMKQGHRFEGTDASASSDLLGIGFRYIAGDVDRAAFLSELSIGIRTITVKNGGETYKMSTWELFRLGLGAEIRLSKLFTISPMGHISSGVMNDSDGNITFSQQGSQDHTSDATRHPTFVNGQNIQSGRGYVVVGIGCGAHFDFFGK